jgi:glycosyltransferase involved in cell wall biosynthesis
MKILYVTSGGSVHEQRFLQKFAESKHTFYYAYLRRNGEQYADPRIPSYYLGFDADGPVGPASRLWAGGRAYFRFRKLLQSLKPDVLHVGPVNSTGLFGALCGFHPLLLMPWGSDILILPQESAFYRIASLYVIHRSDMITCDCESVKTRIVELGQYPAERIVTFPWGIDLQQFRPSAGLRKELRSRLGCESSKVILMNRAFLPVYGIEYFLRALPRVCQTVEDMCVLLIGEGPLKGALGSLVRELNLEKFVRIVGQVANEQMSSFLNAADLYVSTSLSDGTSLSLLEAMACHLPVIVTDVPANLEWVRDGVNGFVVPRRDVHRLADGIIEILQNESLANHMGECNLKIARERADWNKNYAVLEEIYCELEARFHLTGNGAESGPRVHF